MEGMEHDIWGKGKTNTKIKNGRGISNWLAKNRKITNNSDIRDFLTRSIYRFESLLSRF